MAKFRSYDYLCESCNVKSIELLDLNTESKEDTRLCPACSTPMICVPGFTVSTSKTSESIPDVVAKNRFPEIRERRKFAKQAKAARKKGNIAESKEIKQAAKDAGHTIKG